MHLEAIKSKQKEIFNKLQKFSGFYLVGGTALALQIGHRTSVDFDLFNKEDISKNLLKKVKYVFKGSKIEVIVNHSEQLSVLVGGVKIDFVKYKFPIILKTIEINKIKTLKIPEIAAMKAHTLNYRGTFKDYVDLYFILKEKHASLNQIKDLAEKKYKYDFNFRLFLEQIIYLEDIKTKELEFLKNSIDKKEIEEFFKEEIKKHKNNLLK